MKKIRIILILSLFSSQLLAQTPQQFKYQAILRNADGTVRANENVSVEFLILEGSISGNEVFTENHNVTTNEQGLINLNIGSIEDLSVVDWKSSSYYVKIKIDGTDMGVSQLLSVPYALNAKEAETADYNSLTNLPDLYDGKIQFMTRNELDAYTPENGELVYDTTDGVTLMWDGTNWLQLSNNCFPQPSSADAGDNQIITTLDTDIPLSADIPEEGVGTWSILSGAGGSFDDIHNPAATFSGNICTDYILKWTVSTVCNSSSDEVNISFSPVPTVADAGDDIYSPNTNIVTLNANNPTIGSGTWSVIQGDGGVFENSTVNNTVFTGNDNETYVLQWTTSTGCNSSSDYVTLYIGNVIGQYNYGGIIFYVDATKEHGLVCAVSDQSAGAEWGCSGTDISGAGGYSIGTGAQNTIDIVNGCSTSGIAADICASLELNGYDDWFLPSRDEIAEMCAKKDEINKTALLNGGEEFYAESYWSSTEYYVDTNAYRYRLNYCGYAGGAKTDLYRVRAVRTF